MITKENYSEEHIRLLQGGTRKDPLLVERALFAFGLLEALAQVGMKFTFKGRHQLDFASPKTDEIIHGYRHRRGTGD